MGTTASKAAKMVSISNRGGSKGPSNKNVKNRRSPQANPAGMLNSMVGKILTGPDKGAG